MMIAIGSDKSGFALKEAVKRWLRENGIEYTDIGTTDIEAPEPFFRVAPRAAACLQNGGADRAILVCGTGMGMAQVAGKYKGIRAACVESVYSAQMCRAINDSNVLCMGGWVLAPEMAIEMVKSFLNTGFTEGLEAWRADFLKDAKAQFAALEDTLEEASKEAGGAT